MAYMTITTDNHGDLTGNSVDEILTGTYGAGTTLVSAFSPGHPYVIEDANGRTIDWVSDVETTYDEEELTIFYSYNHGPLEGETVEAIMRTFYEDGVTLIESSMPSSWYLVVGSDGSVVDHIEDVENEQHEENCEHSKVTVLPWW